MPWFEIATVGPIKPTYFGEGGFARHEDALSQALNWFQQHVGFKPDDACLGLLAGGLWLTGMKFLKRDTELAPTRLSAKAPWSCILRRLLSKRSAV